MRFAANNNMKQSKTLNLVLCGPGDVAKEIAIAKDVINEWNQRNWESLNCGLKDHHWDTDAVPSMEARGQEVISRQIIDKADVLVAIFWRRLGTPTGLHESGTVEEIRRAQARDIPVMLYFSDIEDMRPVPDADQWDMLQAFRAKAMTSGLPWTFRSRDDFRTRFADHLHKKVVELLARKPKTKAKSAKANSSVSQTATGTGNVQVAGDQNTVNVKTTSNRSPRIVIAPPPGHIGPAEQRQVQEWVRQLAESIVEVEGKSIGQAMAEAWSRLKNEFEVSKYELLRPEQMPAVEAWFMAGRGMLRARARRKAPGVHRHARIGAIKAAMSAMGRTNHDYYPQIAARLGLPAFHSLNDLSAKDLDRVYTLVQRDRKRA